MTTRLTSTENSSRLRLLALVTWLVSPLMCWFSFVIRPDPKPSGTYIVFGSWFWFLVSMIFGLFFFKFIWRSRPNLLRQVVGVFVLVTGFEGLKILKSEFEIRNFISYDHTGGLLIFGIICGVLVCVSLAKDSKDEQAIL